MPKTHQEYHTNSSGRIRDEPHIAQARNSKDEQEQQTVEQSIEDRKKKIL